MGERLNSALLASVAHFQWRGRLYYITQEILETGHGFEELEDDEQFDDPNLLVPPGFDLNEVRQTRDRELEEILGFDVLSERISQPSSVTPGDWSQPMNQPWHDPCLAAIHADQMTLAAFQHYGLFSELALTIGTGSGLAYFDPYAQLQISIPGSPMGTFTSFGVPQIPPSNLINGYGLPPMEFMPDTFESIQFFSRLAALASIAGQNPIEEMYPYVISPFFQPDEMIFGENEGHVPDTSSMPEISPPTVKVSPPTPEIPSPVDAATENQKMSNSTEFDVTQFLNLAEGINEMDLTEGNAENEEFQSQCEGPC